MADIRVYVDSHELTATWNDKNPTTRQAIADALPLEGAASRWGDELYFRTDIDVPPEKTQTAVPVGALAYWPAGNAVCLFWGPTPASHDDEPRGAAPVNVVATVDDVTPLQAVEGSATVRIEET
ncbi:cyclophilin-like fold protein [Halorubrum sp. DTA46]|uniref:cyclophilin-like fold protein n=1 Tax=Halorubrum sp. DTA46 TaxID=3402162 RepID=UPI003AAB847A